MSKHDNLKALVENFVNGYMAGSCNGYNECLNRLIEEVKEFDESICDQQIEQLLDQVIAETEIFLCECCGWWCWAHEYSETTADYCTDCAPNNEDE